MGDSKFSNFDNMSLQSIDQDAELIPLLTPEDGEIYDRMAEIRIWEILNFQILTICPYKVLTRMLS